MPEMEQLYLDNIDEYVHDQDKIVTYKWLSLTLGVHVNTAKQMLFHYLEHKRKESSSALHATFLLSGKSVDHGRTCHKVSVVREEELEDAKSRLSAVVSVHVYSVHKALLRDSAPLFGVDYDAVKSNLHQCNRFSAIRCPDAVPLSKAELPSSREPRSPPPAQTNADRKPQTNAETAAKAKPRGIMGAFASKPKTESKTGTRPESKVEPSEEPVTEASKPAPKSNPMANFFVTQTTKKPVQTVKEESSSSSSTVTEQRPPQADRDQRSKSKRAESDEEEEPQEKKKKRRRIRRPQSDSSDDDERVVPESPPQTQDPPSPEPSVPEERPAPDTAAQDQEPEQNNPATKTRKRRRVLKSKTFLDDEGCMVTEKVYESESYSEDEEVQTKPAPHPGLHPAPKPGPKASSRAPADDKKKRGASGAKATKQASIMGFFNKK